MPPEAARAALVTGASSGIGRATALTLGERGTAVAVGYHGGEERAAEVVGQIERNGGRAMAVQGDMSCESDVERCFETAAKALGPLDACVVNAGIQADAPALDMTLEDWNAPISLDLQGAFLTSRTFLRSLPPREPRSDGSEDTRPSRGALVFVGSVHSRIPWAGHVNYAAAKGGASMLMKSLAQELAATGVRINAVDPGAIRTPINKDVWGDDAALAHLLEVIPQNRLGRPDEVAEAIAWLLSGRADYLMGATLTIDGGMSLYPAFRGNG